MELTPVQSSNVAAVGYDQTQSILYIQFKGRETVYEHHGVPVDTYEQMMAADSIGSFYARNIKKQYQGSSAGSEDAPKG